MFVPLKLVPVTVPVLATELGVIAPSVIVKFGVAPPLELPLTPLAVVTPIAVTVPLPLLLNVFQSVAVK